MPRHEGATRIARKNDQAGYHIEARLFVLDRQRVINPHDNAGLVVAHQQGKRVTVTAMEQAGNFSPI
jgi:hypothetical protein